MSIVSDIQSLEPSAIIELFTLDLTDLGDIIYYFHAGTNELSQDIYWQSQLYTAFPIQIDGFSTNSKGELPRPSMTVSNILGLIGSFTANFNDLIGAKVTRIRTFKKYLDESNFINGNPTADPTVEYPRDIYYINRKVQETSKLVSFELVSPWDLQNIFLPRRQVIQNTCLWKYRGVECGYTGGAVADASDVPTTDPAKDSCSKTIQGCIYRFPNIPLPYGGFPGATSF